MKAHSKIVSTITLCLFSCVFTYAQTINSCATNLPYNLLKSRWNESVKNLKGNWQLPDKINFKRQKETVLYEQSLEGPGLNLHVTITKGGCVKSIEVKAIRDIQIGYASLVGWLMLIKVYNPELSAEDRMKVLDDMKISEKNILINTSTVRGNYKYLFEETGEGNTFSVTVKQ